MLRCPYRKPTQVDEEELIILGAGALRVSSRAFQEEVKAAEAEIREILSSQ